MRFDCACSDDGRERCGTHVGWGCHNDELPPLEDGETQHSCPPCWLARIRSVSLSSDATPTRGKRA